MNNDKFALTLAFKQNTDMYPSPGSIVTVKASVIEEHINYVNSQREANLVLQYPIVTKFAYVYALKGLFYETPLERSITKYDSDIAVKISEFEEIGAKNILYAKCELLMFDFPKDVPQDLRTLNIAANELFPVDIVLCDNTWTYSDELPNNITTFGVVDKKHSMQRLWKFNALFTTSIKLDVMKQFVLEYGLKNFSTLMPKQELFDRDISELIQIQNSVSNKTTNSANNDASEDIRSMTSSIMNTNSSDFVQTVYTDEQLDAILEFHPLRRLAERLTNDLFYVLSKHNCSTELLRTDVVRTLKTATANCFFETEFADEIDTEIDEE